MRIAKQAPSSFARRYLRPAFLAGLPQLFSSVRKNAGDCGCLVQQPVQPGSSSLDFALGAKYTPPRSHHIRLTDGGIR
jgi:hypothetical protein